MGCSRNPSLNDKTPVPHDEVLRALEELEPEAWAKVSSSHPERSLSIKLGNQADENKLTLIKRVLYEIPMHKRRLIPKYARRLTVRDHAKKWIMEQRNAKKAKLEQLDA